MVNTNPASWLRPEKAKFIQQLPVEIEDLGLPFALEQPLVVILNSRQSKMFCGEDEWVKTTMKAVRQAAGNGHIVLTGLEMPTWELACWYCGHLGCRQIIVATLPHNETSANLKRRICADFELPPHKTGWLLFRPTRDKTSGKPNWPLRDKIAVILADIAIPVSLRPGGNLEQMLADVPPLQINDKFRVNYKPHSASRRDFDPTRLPSEKICKMSWEHIAHWTRTKHGPWPTETKAAFYSRLTHSMHYPNDGFHTLVNILRTGFIVGQPRGMRNGARAVGFSSLHPQEALKLMTWRRQLVSYNFEPYAVAITKRAAWQLGIRPVIYGRPTLYHRLSDSDKPYFQSIGQRGGHWENEHEWRYLGDLHLDKINKEDLLVIVEKKEQIDAIAQLTPAKVVSFF